MDTQVVRTRAEAASVLFVHDGENWIRGSERCMLDLVRHIDRRFFRPVVLCDSPLVAEAARDAGATAHLMDGWNEAGQHLLPSRRQARAVRAILDRHDVKLVHCNSALPIKALLPGTRARRIPLLAHLHIIHPLHTRLYLAVHQVSLAVGVSEATVAGLRNDGMAAHRLRVTHNAVDPERMERGDASRLRGELGLSEQDTTLVALGSLIPRKGVDVLIDAMAILGQTNPDVHLLVIGEGTHRSALEHQAACLGLQRTVHFLGEQADIGAILRDAGDIAVSAARQEAFPLNLLEAGYCGMPILASNIPPHRESIVDGETGILVTPDSPADFARNVQWLLSTPTRGRDMGARGSMRVRGEFLLEHYVAAFEHTYLELMARSPRAYGWLAGSSWPPVYSRWLTMAAGRRLGRLLKKSSFGEKSGGGED